MKNWHRSLALACLALALLLGSSLLPAYGQADGCPDGPNCMAAYNFDENLEGWTPELIDAEWSANMTFGLDWGAGLMRIRNTRQTAPANNEVGLHKKLYLQPGQYQIKLRGAQNIGWSWANGVYVVVQSVDVVAHTWNGSLSSWYYTAFTTSAFTLYSPQEIDIRLVTTGNDAFIDYVWVERLADTEPTATEIAPTVTPGGPTVTPRPTYVPTQMQATPMPPGTAVCQPAPAGGIPDYATPTAVFTGTTLSTLDTFSNGPVQPSTLPWMKVGNATVTNGVDHSGGYSGAAMMQYDPHWNETTAASFSHALVLPTNYGYTFWVNAWAQADVGLVGKTAKMEIWQKVGGSWEIVTDVSISSQYWYPLHAEISSAATDIAFVAVRSDTPSGGYAFLDDVYIYAPGTNLPYCDGTYVDGTLGYDTTGTDGVDIVFPSNKACPGGIMQPNNIWGMLLAQVTLFLDAQMAWAPAHVIGTTRDLAQQYMLGPIGGLIMLGTIIFDWQIPIIMLEIYLAFQAGLAIIGIWKTIRRAFFV